MYGFDNRCRVINDGTKDNPFITLESEYYDDIDQSTIYRETLKDVCINQDNEILCPVGLYIDETNLDNFSKITLHPVMKTLMIFNRKIRNSSSAWKCLGYLPNFAEQFGSKKYTPEQKMNDYYFCLRYILDGLEKLLALPFLKWNFNF